MFNIGFSEFMVIGIIALLVIGPKQLPEVARVVGRLLNELKKATQDLSGGLLEVTRDVKQSVEDTRDDILREGQNLIDEANPLNVAKEDTNEEPIPDGEPQLNEADSGEAMKDGHGKE